MEQDVDEEADMNKLFSDIHETDEKDLATDNETDNDEEIGDEIDDDDAKSVDSMSDLFPGKQNQADSRIYKIHPVFVI